MTNWLTLLETDLELAVVTVESALVAAWELGFEVRSEIERVVVTRAFYSVLAIVQFDAFSAQIDVFPSSWHKEGVVSLSSAAPKFLQ